MGERNYLLYSSVLNVDSQRNSREFPIDKQRTYMILNYIQKSFPYIQVMFQWCPGHTDIERNEKVDKLAKKEASKSSQEE